MNDPDRTAVSRVVSELAASHALLNCLIKEFALPENRLSYAWPSEMNGIAPGSYLAGVDWKGLPLVIELPRERQFFVMVDRHDTLGSQRYLSDVYSRSNGGPWSCPSFSEFVEQLLCACQHMADAENHELLEQILQSQHLTAAIVGHNLQPRLDDPLSDYIASEQGLWFGHPNHPAPKARLWPAELSQQAYAPEFRVSTQLHLIEVPLDGLRISANELSDAQVLSGFADQQLARPGHAILCLHPVQAQLFLDDPRVRPLVASGGIIDHGQRGAWACPTASMRTWYVDGHDYFIKGSLNVRITNCVRKNAWYELESALVIDRLFRRLQRLHTATLGGLTVVAEPASLSWAPATSGADDDHWFREQTGAILRENFCLRTGADCSLMAGTLFARDEQLKPLVHDFLGRFKRGAPSDGQLLEWFDRYQTLLLRPVLALFFNHGVVMEPHLQNCVLVHDNGRPVQLLLRDFEGVKLTEEWGVHQLDEDLHPRVRRSLSYSRKQGWQRISYCLFVNNLSEAVLALSWERPHLASRMWQRVAKRLVDVRNELTRAAPELDALIAGQAIACKTNLKVRLAARADRHAGYVELSSPWAGEVSHG
ncbi:IucA/IucC family protein [Halotalea alkalilenta]|uniref:AcsD protein n=1 Tax=Halotalea alkalilenta TaxID=376489 RepID=A0A172YG63_9GAMM|nr:IucA/IucC family protein [Halotalea alkalilenta]ANF58204.1 AcsD protein [Halotalea alkalilenta]